MKRLTGLFCFLATAAMLAAMTAPRCGASVYVSAKSAALVVAETGEIIFGKNENERRPMASTTKIMTSLIALETGTPELEIVTTEEMVTVEGTSMGLLPGDTVTLRTLVCGMLLSSGNDAANTVAIVLGGSVKGFAKMMNARAAEIGMNNTNFVTPSGLDDENHYSTAYDMALLGISSIKNPIFESICSQRHISVDYGNPPYRRTLSNHNRLLQCYEWAIGIKTGFTKKSGRCLVSAARKDGVTLVAVTLSAPDDWNDHVRMLEYGFSVIKSTALDDSLEGISMPVVGGVCKDLALCFASKPRAVLKRGGGEIVREVLLKQFEYAPIHKGEPVGRALYYRDGSIICEADIIAAQSCGIAAVQEPHAEKESEKEPEGLFEKIKEKIKGVFG